MTCGVCNSGFYLKGEVCESCGENTHSTGDRDSIRTCACNEGYEGNVATGGQCSACGEGSYRALDDDSCRLCSLTGGGTTDTTTSNGQDCKCKPGYAGSPPGGNCTMCEADQYSVGNQVSCRSCPTGSTTSGNTGVTSIAGCICEAGYYGDLDLTGQCTKCPDGTFSAKGEAVTMRDCKSCGVFTTTPNTEEGTSIADCQCIAGYAGNPTMTNGVCTRCPEGTWSDVGQATCTSCGENTVTDEDPATSQIHCKCAAGYEGSPGNCTPCPDGSYNGNPGGSCISCGTNTTTGGTTKTSSNACRCKAGFARNSNEPCEACVVNQWSTGETDFCNACGALKETAGPGLGTQESDCKCQAGYIEATDGTCQMCKANQWTNSDENRCQLCPQNRVSDPGSSSEDDCHCPPGYYIDNTDNTDGNACKECAMNTYNNDTDVVQCPSCAGGQTTNGKTGQLACGCPEGEYLDGSTCTGCPQGTFKTGYGDEIDLCVNCTTVLPDSTTVNTSSTGRSECKCRPGYHRVSNACAQCGTEQYKSDISDDSCSDAPGNSTVNSDKTGCECDAGFQLDEGGSTCEQCQAGSWSVQGGNCTECAGALGGSETTVDIATSVSDCGGGRGVSDTPRQTSPGQTPPGRHTPPWANTPVADTPWADPQGMATAADVCAAGYHGNATERNCKQCEGDTYNPTPGTNRNCMDIPGNSTVLTDHTYFECNPGYYTDATTPGHGTCEQCPMNTFKTGTGNEFQMCIGCPDGGTSGPGSALLSDCT